MTITARASAPAAAETEIEVRGPFELRDVLRPHLRGLGDPTMRLSPTEAWRAMRTPDGPATLRLTTTGPGRVRAHAWGTGARWAIGRTGSLIGADDEPLAAVASIAEAVRRYRLLADLVRRRPTLLRIGRTELVWESLLPAILEQKVTGDEARRAWRYLLREHGEPAPGPAGGLRLRVPPAAATLAALPYYAFHPAGVEQRRAETIRRVAAQGDRLEAIVRLPISDANARLLAIPGVGSWTAAEVAFRALGDADAVSVGDYHLLHLVSWALVGERRGSDERMLELLAPFAPHRGRILRLIEASGIGPSRRGPRMTPRRIECL
jgi:3-methyladenine DNA glycosylase/8-oxoguanine DNA glycosylase